MPCRHGLAGSSHFLGHFLQYFGPALEIGGGGFVEPQRHAAGDLMNGMVPGIEIGGAYLGHRRVGLTQTVAI